MSIENESSVAFVKTIDFNELCSFFLDRLIIVSYTTVLMTELNFRVNAVGGNTRTVGDVKKKWADMKVYFKVILLF